MQLSRRTFTFSTAALLLLQHASIVAQTGTPKATEFDNASIRVQDLLQYVPGAIPDAELNLIWNDFERTVAAIYEHNGDAAGQPGDGFLAMNSLYANGPQFVVNAMQLQDFAGYSMDQVMQSMEFGVPPDSSALIRLREDPEKLIPFWESVEYEERANDYGSFWTIGEDAEVDFRHPVQKAMMARFNNVAILPDNVLVYATRSRLLEQVMSTAAGDSPTRITELETIIAGLPSDATSAWIAEGSFFARETLFAVEFFEEEHVTRYEELIADSDEAVGPMPIIRTYCAGTTAGGSRDEHLHNPESREFIILETDAAEQAAEVMRWRVQHFPSLKTGEPYSDILPNLEIEVLDGEFTRASRELEEASTFFPQMIFNRDVLLFAF